MDELDHLSLENVLDSKGSIILSWASKITLDKVLEFTKRK